MYIGVVGSRNPTISKEFFEKKLNESIKSFEGKLICFISGGADGIDTWIKEYAKEKSCAIREYLPSLFPHSPYVGRDNCYFKRNELIATASDLLIAFPSKDKNNNPTGGTLNTINHAKRLGKKVIIY